MTTYKTTWTQITKNIVTKVLRYSVYAIITLALAYSAFQLYTALVQDVTLANEQYKAECQCVREKIALGIERINIATEDGECWVEDNGYYKY